eukprot:SAG31_NODE_2834_length_5019_cov_92.432982_8_plen_44_part_00
MKKVIKFLKGEWNSLMYKLMFKKEKTKTRTCGTIVPEIKKEKK